MSTSVATAPRTAISADPHAEGADYFEKRSLKKGSVSWVMLCGLGVAYAISGDFSGWNYGIAEGGWVGMLVAFIVMGAM